MNKEGTITRAREAASFVAFGLLGYWLPPLVALAISAAIVSVTW